MGNTKKEMAGALRDLPRTGLSDKLDHVIGGLAVYGVTYYLAHKTGIKHPELFGLTATIGIGALLEIFQKFSGGGRADFWDFIATIAPAVLLFAIAKLIS